MPRYECFEGASKKFWSIERKPLGFTVTFGKIGTPGRTQEKSFATEEEATRAHDKAVAEKVKAGYALEGTVATPAFEEGQRPASVPEGAVWVEKDKEWELAPLDDAGQKHGVVQWWRFDGSLVCRCEYRHGIAHGPYARFHENGEVSQEGQFENGNLEGTVTFTRSTGKSSEQFTHGDFTGKVWRVERTFQRGHPSQSFRAFDREGRPCDMRGRPLDSAFAPVASLPAHFAAPPPSPAAQTWTEPTLDTELARGVYFTPGLRRAIAPRRGGIAVPVRPVPTPEEAWAALRRTIWESDRLIFEAERAKGNEHPSSKVWSLVTADDAPSRRLGERLLDPAPRTLSFDDDVHLARQLLRRYGPLAGHNHDLSLERLADFLVATVGIEEAVSRLFAGMDTEMPHAGTGPFERLRDLLSVLDDATYERAAQAIVASAQRELDATRSASYVSKDRIADLRWAASFLLPLGPRAGEVERALHDEAMQACGRFGNFYVHAAGLASGDLATLERYRTANGQTRHEFFYPGGARMYLASLMDLEGAAVATTLTRMKPDDPWTTDVEQNSRWAFLLAHFDEDAALSRLLEEHKADPRYVWGASGLALAFTFQPERVKRLLESAGESALLARIESGDVPVLSIRAQPFDATFPVGDPFPYPEPKAARAKPFTARVTVESVVDFRPEERELALSYGAEKATWDGVEVPRLDATSLEKWVEHRERWRLPSSITDLASAPASLHARLLALGFDLRGHQQRFLGHASLHVGLPIVPFLSVVAAEAPEYALAWMLPFGDSALAPAALLAFSGKKHKALGRSWLLRHTRQAVAGALTMLVDGDKDEKTHAVRGLRYLDSRGAREVILALAREAGIEALARETIESDPFSLPRAKLPKLPKFADAEALPTLVASDGAHVPRERTARLLLELAASNADEVHPGVLAIRASTTAASRATFAWALFEAWLAAGADAKESWAMQALGPLGDDECVRKLVALAKEWPGQNASARAQSALDVLMNIGSDLALMNMSLLAEKSKFPAFKAAAAERIAAVADGRGLTTDELADRLVPTLGLEEASPLTIALGDKTLTVSFDESLRPVLRDPSGATLTAVPKPKKGDDKAQFKAAATQFTALVKDAKTSASLHVSRLERAMQSGRLIDASVFLSCFVRHPWMRHLARRVVWITAPKSPNEKPKTFRIAEDGTLASAEDNVFELPPGTAVKVAHPLDLADVEKKQWGQVFADYEMLQPFPQLARPTSAPTLDEANAEVLQRFEGKAVTHGAIRSLQSRGWQLWVDSSINATAKALAPRLAAVLDFEPGWYPGASGGECPPQKLGGVRLVKRGAGETPTFGQLTPVAFSELVYDLHQLVSSDAAT